MALLLVILIVDYCLMLYIHIYEFAVTIWQIIVFFEVSHSGCKWIGIYL